MNNENNTKSLLVVLFGVLAFCVLFVFFMGVLCQYFIPDSKAVSSNDTSLEKVEKVENIENVNELDQSEPRIRLEEVIVGDKANAKLWRNYFKTCTYTDEEGIRYRLFLENMD